MQTVKCAVIALTVWAIPMTAKALTVADVVALSQAGVSDVVLTALVDADRTIFTLSTEQILALRDAGVSDAVVVKMIGSRKEFAASLPAAAAVAEPYFIAVPLFIDARTSHHGARHRPRRDDPSNDMHGGHDRSRHSDTDGTRARALPPGAIRNGEFVNRQ
jgi:hypothetical protein